jgi:hypothetical protein
MNREYHRGYSQELHRDMEALVFGHGGSPLLVFPTSMGRFFEYEDRGMIRVLAPKIESGELQVFCPDAVDTESWYNKSIHPRQRVLRHFSGRILRRRLLFQLPAGLRAEDERRLVSEPLAANEDRAGIGRLGYVSGPERENVGDAE